MRRPSTLSGLLQFRVSTEERTSTREVEVLVSTPPRISTEAVSDIKIGLDAYQSIGHQNMCRILFGAKIGIDSPTIYSKILD
jgi:hypothetical protein